MRNLNPVYLALALSLPYGLAAANQRQLKLTTPCSRLLPSTPGYSDIARRAGLHYVMFHVDLPGFAALVKANATMGRNGSGKRDLSTQLDFSLDGKRTYDRQLIPLLQRDVGKWANYLIGGGSDFINQGVRTRLTLNWHVGILFPVDLLDELPFYIVPKHSPSQRFAAMHGGGQGDVFSPQIDARERFTKELASAMEHYYSDSFDAGEYFSLEFASPLPLSRAALIWFPAPLLRWVEAHPDLFATLAAADTPQVSWWYELPNEFPPIRMQLSVHHGTEWIPLAPEPPRADEVWDPARRIGTWYTTVPNWETLPWHLAPPRNLTPAEPKKITARE